MEIKSSQRHHFERIPTEESGKMQLKLNPIKSI